MLTNLYIENIAVIEKSRIDFTGGLNVLTGETGAGKSIVIDSINAVLGHRSSRGMIRSGADAAACGSKEPLRRNRSIGAAMSAREETTTI